MRSTEWGHLAQGEEERDQAYKERMRDLGLCFRSRVLRPRETVAQGLQTLLHVSRAEADAIAAASRLPPDLAEAAAMQSDGIAAERTDIESSSEDDLSADAAPNGRLPPQPDAPPPGFERRARWAPALTATGGKNMRVIWAATCPKDGASVLLWKYRELRRFFDAHFCCTYALCLALTCCCMWFGQQPPP